MKSNMLRFMLSFILSVVAAYVYAQKSSKEPTLATESIVGKWQLQKVYAGSREISNNPNATTQSWIEFRPDGTYEQSADDGDRGTYRLNEDQSIVYLESSEEKQTKSVTTVNSLNEFELSIRDGVMVLTAKGDDNSGSTKYVYSKGTEQQ